MTSPISTDHPNTTLRVGDLARRTGKTVRAIHLYEELGLLEPASRSRGGFRQYDESAVERVRWIELLSGLGFSLQEMKSVLDHWWGADRGPEAMADLRALFQKKLGETRDAIRRHQQLELELLEGLRYLETCRTCGQQGTTHACVTCEQDHGRDDPVLVAGFKTGPATVRPSRPSLVRIDDSNPS
jgi:DNA-binding transcriptional MerR regulator